MTEGDLYAAWVSPAVDRIRALGNAVCPPVAAIAWTQRKASLLA